MSYKKVRTVFINDKKKVIYMKAKGTREYVKSKGEMVLLTSYLKKVEKVAAKKAMESKLAKKSPKVKRSTKYVKRGGFFFATEESKDKKGGVNFNSGGNVGMGGTGSTSSQQMSMKPSESDMLPSMMSTQPQQPPQMSQQPPQMPPQSQQMPPQMPQQMPQQMPEMMGGYYNVNNNAEIFKGAKQVVDQLFGELNKAAQVTGGKKAKKGKKVMKKETNPFKNFMNTLSLKKKQRKGKKRGGAEDDGDLSEVY
jgi:hypothetical protein